MDEFSALSSFQRSYKNELELIICGSSNRLKLHLSGQGLEPRLEFRPPALKMGWMLVDSDGVEATVVVKNPCNFPIEFYSLDFDEQYLEEEKVRSLGPMYTLPKLHSTPAFPGLCQGDGGNPQGKASPADMLWEDLN